MPVVEGKQALKESADNPTRGVEESTEKTAEDLPIVAEKTPEVAGAEQATKELNIEKSDGEIVTTIEKDFEEPTDKRDVEEPIGGEAINESVEEAEGYVGGIIEQPSKHTIEALAEKLGSSSKDSSITSELSKDPGESSRNVEMAETFATNETIFEAPSQGSGAISEGRQPSKE